MSLLATVEAEIHSLADHAKKIEEEVLPAAAVDARKAEALLASPLAEMILGLVHVPAEEVLKVAAPVLDFLARAYPAPDAPAPVDPAAPVVADPAAPAAEPAPVP